MNIELSYIEAVDVKVALTDYIEQSLSALDDETFREKYPALARSLANQIARDRTLLLRIEAELDRIR